MQVHHSPTTSSYTFILTEGEWYLGTEQEKLAWVNQIMRQGAEAKANNINILVKPDDMMSVSPVAHTHSVYCHIVRNNEPAKTAFGQELTEAVATWRQQLSRAEMQAIAREIFG